MTSAVDWTAYDGVLLDLDGVVTPTAEIHERAWAELFRPWGFEAIDYLTYVDGKPRYDGVRSFLASRDVVLPDGAETDPPGEDSVCALGNRKNELFTSMLERAASLRIRARCNCSHCWITPEFGKRSCRLPKTPARCWPQQG